MVVPKAAAAKGFAALYPGYGTGGTEALFGRAAGVEVPSRAERIAARIPIEPGPAMKSIAASIIVIIVCGGIGGVAAWWLTASLGLSGVVGGLVAAAVGMVIAVAAFAGTTSLLRGVGWMK